MSNNRVESLPEVARTALHGPNFFTTKSASHKAAAHARRWAALALNRSLWLGGHLKSMTKAVSVVAGAGASLVLLVWRAGGGGVEGSRERCRG